MNDALRNAFYEEADELLQQIEDCLLDIDAQGTTKEKIDQLFRYMHTLKGSSGAMEIHDMEKLTHHLEDILGLVRENKLDFSGEMIDLMLRCLDELRIRVSKHKKDEPYEIDVDKYILALETCKSKKQETTQANPVENTSNQEERNSLLKPLGMDERAYKIVLTLHKDTALKGARLYLITDRLKQVGQIIKTSWDGVNIEEIEGEIFELTFVSTLEKKEIEDLIFSVSDIEKVDVVDIHPEAQTGRQENNKEEIQSVIRVNINKLDQLLRIVEELSVDKERLKQLMKKVEQKYKTDIDVKSLSSLVSHIDFIVNDMQESVMSTRMYTLDSVFNRFHRVVRDLSRKQGKEIELKVEGESTELDRSIMEKIIDPLNHMIRNSIDHGIEAPDEREKKGKKRKGTIKLSAGQEQGHIYIKVEDDGRGINLEELKSSAVKKGLLTKEQVDSFTEKEVLDIIFMPGFSTSKEITDISGRGVGMNVVKENIERINGIIEVDNREGQGLSITLKLPLTLAIIQSLLIKTSRYKFALPLLSIIEILKIKENEYEKQVKFVQGKEVMNWRGEVLPIMRVSDLFCMNEKLEQNSFIGIVIGFSTKKVILGVDEIIGQQQIVIKSLERYIGKDNILGELKGISGTVILGDGDLAYVLDVQTLIKEVLKNRKGVNKIGN